MHLVVVGLNHKTAPLELRERLAVGPDSLAAALTRLRSHAHGAEFCIVSTCNRTELYAVTRTRVGDDMLVSFLAGYSGAMREELSKVIYRFSGHHAVRHLFEVACGLDSMALGETQILGQIRDAFCVAGKCDSTGRVLNNLFQRAIAVGKRARTETAISCGTFSIGAAAAQLAKVVFGDLKGRKGLILGTGEMSKLAATHLMANGVGGISVATRTRAHAEQLARSLGGTAIDFDSFGSAPREVDFCITSTAATQPIITRELMDLVVRDRACAPLFLIDIAVPRDVAPDVAELDSVFVYNIDDLQFLVDRCSAERENEVGKVQEIIAEETSAFMAYLRTLEAVPLIKQLRSKFESVYHNEWERYSSKLEHLSEEDRAYVRKMLKSVVNKLSHDPILRLKDYTADGAEPQRLDIVRELFGLNGAPDTDE